MELSNVQSNRLNCLSHEECVNGSKYQKYVSIVLLFKVAEDNYPTDFLVGEDSEPLECRLEDGVFVNTGLSMIMFHGDTL